MAEIVKFPRLTIKRIGKELHPETRITESALERLQEVITDFARVLLDDSSKLAEHAGRKTVNERDVLLASS